MFEFESASSKQNYCGSVAAPKYGLTPALLLTETASKYVATDSRRAPAIAPVRCWLHVFNLVLGSTDTATGATPITAAMTLLPLTG